MVEQVLQRRTPLGPLADELERVCSGERFSCREDAFRVLTELRCPPAAEAEAAALAEIDLPKVGNLASGGNSWVLGLGPGWWLVDAPDGSPPVRGADFVSAVDVSAQRTALVLAGDASREVLSFGCSLDLHRRAFPVGSAAQTLLAKAGVMLAHTDVNEYRLWVRASFARYLTAWIIDASLEYR